MFETKTSKEIFNDIFLTLKEFFPETNLFQIAVQQESFQIAQFLIKRAEFLTDENYQIACESKNPVLVSFVLNQYAVHYDVKRQTKKVGFHIDTVLLTHIGIHPKFSYLCAQN